LASIGRSGRALRRIAVGAALATVVALPAGHASAAPTGPRALQGPLGIVRPDPNIVTGGRMLHAAPPNDNCPTGQTPAQCNLAYHQGPVMRTNKVYAIYWIPSGYTVSAQYTSVIDRYFTDVAAASGTADNVYSVGTQFSDTSGAIADQSTFGGSLVDTDAFPAHSSASDPLNACQGADDADAACLSDPQLQAEIQNVIQAQGWPENATTMYFLMTPQNVGSCLDDPVLGVVCSNGSNVGFCAYHSSFADTGTGQPVIYANEPYDLDSNFFGVPVCSGATGQGSPNDAAADATINTISHEHNEAITDPFGTGWWNDGSGQENGDNCAWVFGTPQGSSGGEPYNQTINGDRYSLQEEWSNDNSGCAQRYPWTAPSNTAPPAASGAPRVGQILSTTHGAWTQAPTGYAYRWLRCAADGTACSPISGATASTYRVLAADDGHAIRSAVSATNGVGSSNYVQSGPTGTVAMLPAATSGPTLSGVAAVGKALATTDGTWNTSASFTYQWLRCAADGSGCGAIAGASANTYAVDASDAGHTLRAVVTATDAAGATSAWSAASPVVVDVPRSTDLPRISGKRKVGRRLSVSSGSWTWSPLAYRYQWLRCNAHGRSCRPIPGATHSTYRLRRRDAGHRLRARITATNAAGSGAVTSRAGKTVRR
jgi:hypothetical protein